jgi:hypothetical protein
MARLRRQLDGGRRVVKEGALGGDEADAELAGFVGHGKILSGFLRGQVSGVRGQSKKLPAPSAFLIPET